MSFALAGLAAAPAHAADKVGMVARVQPDSYQAAGRVGYPLQMRDPIIRDARVYTKLFGTIQILLDDGSDLMISPNSSITIDDYVYAGDDAAGSLSLTLATGALRAISGRMAKGSYRVDTAVATIGVRGTRYWLDVDEPGVLKIWTDEGVVVARPLNGDRVYEFTAPVYAECTITACEETEAPPKPVKFPDDPRRK